MKKIAGLSVLLFFAVLMLLPASSRVNYNVTKPIVADGDPMPPPIPPCCTSATSTFVADGDPMPPPIPPKPSLTAVTPETLLADDDPIPLPIPPKPDTQLATWMA